MTREEALARALDWAEGRRSHWNEILDAEPRDARGIAEDARQRSFVACAEADAAEVAKWSALAQALPDGPPAGVTLTAEHFCPDCRVERTDYEGPDGAYLPTCPNCGSDSPPAPEGTT